MRFIELPYMKSTEIKTTTPAAPKKTTSAFSKAALSYSILSLGPEGCLPQFTHIHALPNNLTDRGGKCKLHFSAHPTQNRKRINMQLTEECLIQFMGGLHVSTSIDYLLYLQASILTLIHPPLKQM